MSISRRESAPRRAAELLSRDEARRVAGNVAKLPGFTTQTLLNRGVYKAFLRVRAPR